MANPSLGYIDVIFFNSLYLNKITGQIRFILTLVYRYDITMIASDVLKGIASMNNKGTTTSTERVIRVQNGWIMLVVLIGLLLCDIAHLIFSTVHGIQTT